MDAPKDVNDLLRTLHNEPQEVNLLSDEDNAYLMKLIQQIRAGKRAVIIVEQEDQKLKYMFSNSSRPECIDMMGKVISASARRWFSGDV